MPSLSPDYLARLRFDVEKVVVLGGVGEHGGKQPFHLAQPPEVLSDLRQIAVAESSAASNRLEGVVVGAQRLKSLLLKNAAPRSRSEQEVAGYRDALGWIHDSGAQTPFSEAGILQLHGILCRYRAQPGGHWKSADNDIIERRAEGRSRIRWRPVAAHRAPMVLPDIIPRTPTT